MDDELQRRLTELEEAIESSRADGHIDEEEKAELRMLLERTRTALAAPEGEDEGIVEHLEEATVRFESRHPTVAAAIRSAVDTLTGLGM